MNQSILFSERVEYDTKLRKVTFFAQVNGLSVPCVYTVNDDSLNPLMLFEQKRFDYEELAEVAIENENYNESGEIELEEL